MSPERALEIARALYSVVEASERGGLFPLWIAELSLRDMLDAVERVRSSGRFALALPTDAEIAATYLALHMSSDAFFCVGSRGVHTQILLPFTLPHAVKVRE